MITPRENRQQIWDEYQGDKPPHMEHPWLHYDRYRYSDQIIQTLTNRHEDFTTVQLVDYGSGVGDYGFEFGRRGSEVYFYDNPTYLNFIKFRLEKEPIKFVSHLLNSDDLPTFPESINGAIFGEVLEHLDNPLQALTAFVTNNTKYIYTSSYPYRSDDPNNPYWNHRGHVDHSTREMQPACRNLLETSYERVKYNGEASLWIRK